jgi:four helix bundle suffix protein
MSGRHGQSGRSGPRGRVERKGEELFPKHGGYRNLKSSQIAQLVYDVTVRCCDRYIDKRIRTHGQMVQSARSGVQNIAEGSKASGTSKKTELKLTNVARASLDELRLDYEDFLRQRGYLQWERDDTRRKELIDRRCIGAADVACWIREVHERGAVQRCNELFMRSTSSIRSNYPEIAANAALTLIAVACSLLDRQLAAQAAAFEQGGGFTERLYRKRYQVRRTR